MSSRARPAISAVTARQDLRVNYTRRTALRPDRDGKARLVRPGKIK